MDYAKAEKNFKSSLLFNNIGNTLVSNIFVVWATEGKGFDGFQISLLTGLIPIAVLPAVFIWGRVIDKTKKLTEYMIIIHILNSIFLFLMTNTINFKFFFCLNFFRNIVILPASGLNEEYLMNLVQQGKLQFGRIRMYGTIGYGAAGVLGAILLRKISVDKSVLAGIIMLLLSVVFMKRLPKMPVLNMGAKEKRAFSELFRNEKFMRFLVLSCSIMGVMTAAAGFGLQQSLLNMGCPVEFIGLLPFIMVLMEILFLRVMDKSNFSEKVIYSVALGICAIRWGVMAIASSYVWIILGCLGRGIVAGMIMSQQNRKVGELVEAQYQSTAFLVMSGLLFTIVPSFLNFICGNLMEIFGYKVIPICYLIFSIPGIWGILGLVYTKE